MTFLEQLFAAIASFAEWLKWWVVVEQEQLGFIRRWGVHHREVSPGLHWKCPVWERAETEDGRPYVYLLDPQSLTTADGVLLVVRLTVTVTVIDVRKFYRTVFDGRQNVQDVAAGELGEAVRCSNCADVLGTAVLQRVSRKLRAAAKDWGMSVSDVRFVDCARARSYRLWQTQTTHAGQA